MDSLVVTSIRGTGFAEAGWTVAVGLLEREVH